MTIPKFSDLKQVDYLALIKTLKFPKKEIRDFLKEKKEREIIALEKCELQKAHKTGFYDGFKKGEQMSMLNEIESQHRVLKALYSNVARALDNRIDMTPKQKNEVIHLIIEEAIKLGMQPDNARLNRVCSILEGQSLPKRS